MAKDWVTIAADLRVAGRPITGILKARYDDRDSALKEDWCGVPQLNATASDSSWATVLDSFIWVPTWAITLNVEIATFNDIATDVFVRLKVNATVSASLTVDWTSTQNDTLTLTVDPGDRGTQQELLIQDDDAFAETIDITLKNLWWSQ